MKKLLPLTCFFVVMHLLVFGQTPKPDWQWLIQNNKGKDGASVLNGWYYNNFGTGQNITYAPTVGQTKFNVEEVRHPNRQNNYWRPKNDIFVIYTNGTFFSSREKGTTTPYQEEFDVFYPYHHPAALNSRIHNFLSTSASSIEHLYLSNLYEDDDLPLPIRVTPGLVTTTDPTYTFQTTNLTSQLPIAANHDVVRDKDVTLILKRDSLRAGDEIVFNEVSRLGPGDQPTVGNYFITSSLFNAAPQFSNVNCQVNGNRIKILGLDPLTPNNPPYVFINLRGTENLPAYFEGRNDLNYEAHFSVVRGGKKMNAYSYSESIIGSHDPNYLKVLSVCQTGTEQFVRYHAEFLNTGRTNANNLKIKLRFPKFIDKLCMDDLVFYAGGNIYRGSIDTSSNRYFRIVTFIFPPEASVGPYHPGNVQGSTGYVEFCIKVKQDHDVTSYGTRLKPYVAQVNFGHQSYLLRDFVDLLPDYKGKVGEAYRLADGPCGCTCKKRLAERDRNRRT